MYDYDNEKINNVKDIDVEDVTNECLKRVDRVFSNGISGAIDNLQKTNHIPVKDIKQVNIVDSSNIDDDDEVAKELSAFLDIPHVTEAGYSGFSNCCFQFFRKDASNKSDMEDIEISSLTEYASILKNFNGSKLDTMQSRTDKAFKNAIKQVDKCEKLINDDKANKTDFRSNVAKLLSKYSSMLSKTQSLYNTYISAWKTAAKERDSAYKSMIVKAIAYSKKQDKNK